MHEGILDPTGSSEIIMTVGCFFFFSNFLKLKIIDDDFLPLLVREVGRQCTVADPGYALAYSINYYPLKISP